MSPQPVSLSPDLRRLRDEGYDIRVTSTSLLVVDHVPYVATGRSVAYGQLVSELTLSGDVTARPSTHVASLVGSTPCDVDGQPLNAIINGTTTVDLGNGQVQAVMFSSKPSAGYLDYYEKMTTYTTILSGPAQSLDPSATAKTFPPVADDDPYSVFKYRDTASSRAGIVGITEKLKLAKVAIVGLGGTGSYVLDLVAKTPVQEIHLFDGDVFYSHNAFRSPGAASLDELRHATKKVDYYTSKYAAMRDNIVPHDHYVDAAHVEELRNMNFVFLTMEGGATKRLIVKSLETFDIPFIDVGLGVYETTGSLGGAVRVTTSTPQQRTHVWERDPIPFADGDDNNDYDRNIQIADLNALNAALAVIKWKKLCGFYLDLEHEHSSVYTVDGDHLANEDQA